VTDWARAVAVTPVLRYLRVKATALACRAQMNDEEFVHWCEDILPLLIKKGIA
jgi:hypothetical protein